MKSLTELHRLIDHWLDTHKQDYEVRDSDRNTSYCSYDTIFLTEEDWEDDRTFYHEAGHLFLNLIDYKPYEKINMEEFQKIASSINSETDMISFLNTIGENNYRLRIISDVLVAFTGIKAKNFCYHPDRANPVHEGFAEMFSVFAIEDEITFKLMLKLFPKFTESCIKIVEEYSLKDIPRFIPRKKTLREIQQEKWLEELRPLSEFALFGITDKQGKETYVGILKAIDSIIDFKDLGLQNIFCELKNHGKERVIIYN